MTIHLSAEIERKLSAIPTHGSSSYVCQAALVCEMLKISSQELLRLFAAHEGNFAVDEWDVKYLQDRDWVAFDRRVVPLKESDIDGVSMAIATQAFSSKSPVPRDKMTLPAPKITIAPCEELKTFGTVPRFDPVDVGNRARTYQDEARRKGTTVPTATEAVEHILSKIGWCRSDYGH